MENKLKYRMYGMVPFNISPIQQGIQFGHAVVEYTQKYFNTEEYQKWATVDKTFIILNGGTSSTMLENQNKLIDMNLHIGSFYEPDLNNMLSGIVFLVDERVYDRENYPDFRTWMSFRNPHIKQLIKEQSHTDLITTFETSYNEWSDLIGGEKNVRLKEFLTNFKLA